MTPKLTVKVGALTLASITLAGCAYLGLGSPDPRWADYTGWTKANDQPITGDHTHILGNLHQGADGYRDIYVNDIGRDTMLDPEGPYNYPVGTVIVKEQYRSQSAYERGGRPGLTGPGITVMLKVADSNPTQASDWQWSRGYTMTASEDDFCSACHMAAYNSDLNFVNGASLPDFMRQ